ncbi:acid sphingomyelinase-like phosphodiesterase 3b [Dermacentor silvarum]|uniref:acid sphingomyelinase-like phosphodiesterase 3b n=1 Tax=Dermacentor silvarum TaxID=543639 RepID=UPI00189958AC|nr:acid sphingomyelinase-like phosphodiesterase 3b [Dermacentor silvarum]
MAKIFARQTSRLRRLIVGSVVRNTMAIRAVLLLLFCVALVRLASTVYVTSPHDDIGYFWHVTDFHVDKDYSTRGSRDLSCHRDANRTTLDDIGAYGDFLCDAPKLLAQSAVEAMERIHPTTDFILWTGDNLPHVSGITWADMFNETRWIGDLLWRWARRHRSFVVPTLGNHDWVPANAMESKNATLYRGFLIHAGFNQLLPEDAWATFEQGGYYSRQLSKNIRLVCLNSVLWYSSNKGERPGPSDPQMAWLRDQLHDAQHQGQKVFISGHIGPGYFSRSLVGQPASVVFFEDINDRYQDLIAQYKDIVAGQFFGHQHMNAFVLLSDKNGSPVSSMHLAGSVTPWGSKDPVYRSLSEPTNPCVRLYTYRRSTGELLDYSVYYLNLDKANAAAASQQQPEWEFLYSASKDFGQRDLSTDSMVELAHRLTASPELLSRYINLSSALKDTGPCDASCRKTMLCAVLGSRHDSHAACISQKGTVLAHTVQLDGHSEATTTVRDVLVGLSVSLVIVVGIVLVVRAKRARMMQGPRYGRFR